MCQCAYVKSNCGKHSSWAYMHVTVVSICAYTHVTFCRIHAPASGNYVHAGVVGESIMHGLNANEYINQAAIPVFMAYLDPSTSSAQARKLITAALVSHPQLGTVIIGNGSGELLNGIAAAAVHTSALNSLRPQYAQLITVLTQHNLVTALLLHL